MWMVGRVIEEGLVDIRSLIKQYQDVFRYGAVIEMTNYGGNTRGARENAIAESRDYFLMRAGSPTRRIRSIVFEAVTGMLLQCPRMKSESPAIALTE